MNHVSDRLQNINQIKQLITDLDRNGIWKNNNILDQATIEDKKDENLRILNLIETELERAGLWDKSVDSDKNNEIDQKNNIHVSVTTDQILQNAKKALEKLKIKR